MCTTNQSHAHAAVAAGHQVVLNGIRSHAEIEGNWAVDPAAKKPLISLRNWRIQFWRIDTASVVSRVVKTTNAVVFVKPNLTFPSRLQHSSPFSLIRVPGASIDEWSGITAAQISSCAFTESYLFRIDSAALARMYAMLSLGKH